jgi:hypothetical protein
MEEMDGIHADMSSYPSEDKINCKDITQQKLLELLLMFVAYCVNVLKKAPTSIPGIL